MIGTVLMLIAYGIGNGNVAGYCPWGQSRAGKAMQLPVKNAQVSDRESLSGDPK